MAAVDRKAMPAEAKAVYEPFADVPRARSEDQGENVGIVNWKTIAPVMLPIDRVSLFTRTQMIELNFSGSSVAIGATTSASSSSSMPRAEATCSTPSTKKIAPATMQPRATATWT